VTAPIYLDAQATTPVDPRVLEVMMPYFTEKFGNAASRTHAYGWAASAAVDKAREGVARAVGAVPEDIVFTSGATESNNLALSGVMEEAAARGRDHVVTTAIEHPSVLDVCARLERVGLRVTRVPVEPDGIVDPERVAKALEERTALVSVMLANNEIGTLQPVREIGRITRERGVLLHTDAAQAVGKLPIDVDAMGIDLLSMSAHKLYGPKGVGALYVRTRRPRVALAAQIHGGGHERGRRSGTLDVPGIVGFGAACALLQGEGGAEESRRVRALRDQLLSRLESALPGVAVNGDLERRLPGNLNVSFEGVESGALLGGLPGLAFSSGSACASAKPEPSHVLAALGLPEARRRGAVRFGVSRFTTPEEIERASELLVAKVRELRSG